MSNQTFASVWDALEDTQAEAARQLRVTQPRISDLMRGKIHLFGLESLVDLASAAGLRVELSVQNPA